VEETETAAPDHVHTNGVEAAASSEPHKQRSEQAARLLSRGQQQAVDGDGDQSMAIGPQPAISEQLDVSAREGENPPSPGGLEATDGQSAGRQAENDKENPEVGSAGHDEAEKDTSRRMVGPAMPPPELLEAAAEAKQAVSVEVPFAIAAHWKMLPVSG
jgi:hypothetical protein